MGWCRKPSPHTLEIGKNFCASSSEVLICYRSNCLREFHPSTDPAAAMQVLEKCADKLDDPKKYNPGVSPITKSGGQWWVGNQHAETLPLAICLFAKQLFSK